MKKGRSKVINASLLTGFLILLLGGANSAVYGQEEGFFLPELQPYYSADGQTLYDAVPPLVIVVDPNPEMQGIKVAGPTAADALAAPETDASTFSFTYVAAGGKDPWGQVCDTFPRETKTSFNAAAAIWAKTLKSPVPIKISACWANLGDTITLGYSGGQPLHKDFSGAPKANTWYQGSLANSIYGSDLDSAGFDMYITFNSGVTWYYGTDGNPPAREYDLVTVAAHEIGHGLNFSETASYSEGRDGDSMMVYAVASGSSNHSAGTETTGLLKGLGWQLATESAVPTPLSPGGKITDKTPTYTWTTVPLATQYRYQLVKGTTTVYTKSVAAWTACGISTCTNTPAAALGYFAYKWRVQAQVDGVWGAYSAYKTFAVQVPVPTPRSPTGTISDTTPTYTWTKVAGAVQYRFQLVKDSTTVYTNTVAASACGTSTCTNTPATALGYSAYEWKVQAQVDGVWSAYSAFKTFAVKVPVPTPQSPTGTISDTTPTYSWTTVTGATHYRYELVKDTTTVYTNTVASSACGTSTCTNTPATALGYFAYKWRVQAQVDGVWSAYSAFKTFAVKVPVQPPNHPLAQSLTLPPHTHGPL